MNSSTLYSILLTLCLTLISQSSLPTNARAHAHHVLLADDHDLIGQICNEIEGDDRINCMNILRADPRILHAKNFVEFSKAVLKLALNKGIKGQKFLKRLVKTKYSAALEECANFNYDEVVGSFRSSLGELKEDPMTANYDAKVAGDGPATCERVLAAAHIVIPAVSALNHQISLLSEIAFLATNEIGD